MPSDPTEPAPAEAATDPEQSGDAHVLTLLGWSPDAMRRDTTGGAAAAAIAVYRSLHTPERDLVDRLLDSPRAEDVEELMRHQFRSQLSRWLLAQPAFSLTQGGGQPTAPVGLIQALHRAATGRPLALFCARHSGRA